MTKPRISRIRRSALALAAAATLLGPGSRLVGAQERTAVWTARERARIGVLLEERCEQATIERGRCDLSPLVTSVVVNGPADRAGIASGDTLLSIDGLPVTSPQGREALLSLEDGVTVELEVGRGSGRLAVEVTPEMRADDPYVDVRTSFFGPPRRVATAEGDQEVRVMRIPSVRSRWDEVEVRLDSLREGDNEFVFFHEDSVGRFRVEVGDREKAAVLLRRLREPGPVGEVHEGRHGVEDQHRNLEVRVRGVATAIPGYVWENAKLAERLTKVRDSALRSARVHLDSLVSLQSRFRVLEEDSLALTLSVTTETDPQGEWAYFVGPRQVSGEVRALFLTEFRIAGAEFRELHGDLADYFEGTDEGLLVIRVIPDTPAARAGLKEGDVLVEVNGRKCHDVSALRREMGRARPGAELEVEWIRKGERLTGRLGVS